MLELENAFCPHTLQTATWHSPNAQQLLGLACLKHKQKPDWKASRTSICSILATALAHQSSLGSASSSKAARIRTRKRACSYDARI